MPIHSSQCPNECDIHCIHIQFIFVSCSALAGIAWKDIAIYFIEDIFLEAKRAWRKKRIKKTNINTKSGSEYGNFSINYRVWITFSNTINFCFLLHMYFECNRRWLGGRTFVGGLLLHVYGIGFWWSAIGFGKANPCSKLSLSAYKHV